MEKSRRTRFEKSADKKGRKDRSSSRRRQGKEVDTDEESEGSSWSESGEGRMRGSQKKMNGRSGRREVY